MDLDTIGLRILLGVADTEPTRWDGKVRLTAGEIRRIEPWRFRPDDQIIEATGWTAASYQLNNPPQGEPRRSPTGVVLTIAAPRGAQLEVATPQGEFRVPLDDAKPGQRLLFLDGRVQVDRVAPAVAITSGGTENDFPAVATGPDGGVWVAYVAHTHRGPASLAPFDAAPDGFKSLIPSGGGDQLMLVHFNGRRWSEAIALSEPGLDVGRPAIAIDRGLAVRVSWPQNVDGNWDLFEAIHVPAAGGPERKKPGGPDLPGFLPRAMRRTSSHGADIEPALATDRGGINWLAWRAWRDGQADIWLEKLEGGPEPPGQPVQVTDSPAGEWSPALAIDSKRRVHIAYDSYRNGNYDVYLRTFADGRLSEPIAVATSLRFEARPSIVCDAEDRVWVAYEQRAVTGARISGRSRR